MHKRNEFFKKKVKEKVSILPEDFSDFLGSQNRKYLKILYNRYVKRNRNFESGLIKKLQQEILCTLKEIIF